MWNLVRGFLPSRGDWPAILFGILSLAGLYAVSRDNFLVFHCLTEAFSIVIAVAVFAIFWNTRQYVENGAYLVLGFGCLFAGVLDLIYVFAYPGMSVFPGADGNIALQAKTAAQWFVSFSCVGFFPFLRRPVNQNLMLGVYGVFLALALGAIFYWRVFPECYRGGVGQTGFERIGLVLSCGAYLTALALLVRNRHEFDGYVFKLLAGALIAFFVEDLASALSTDIDDSARSVAHLCQIVALYFVYKAFVEVGLRKPYDLVFRKQQQTAETLQIIFDSVPAGIFFKDKENRFLRVNRAFAEIMGMPVEQLEGRSVADLYPGEQAAAYWKDDQEVMARGKPKTGIVEPMQTTTETRWVQTDKIPYRDGRGNTIGIVGFLMDITERKRAEEALKGMLRDHQDRLKFATDAAELGAWELDLVNGTAWRSLWHDRIFGYDSPLQNWSYEQFLEHVLPEDRPGVDGKFRQAVAARQSWNLHCRILRRDGVVRWIWAQGRSLYGEHGEPVQMLGLVQDITPQKEAEEALRESQADLKRAQFVANTGSWRWDKRRDDIHWSDETYRIFGIPKGTPITNQGFLASVHPEDRDYVARMWAAALSGTPYDIEHRIVVEGRTKWVRERAELELDSQGNVRGGFGTVADITARKAAEEALMAQRDLLRTLIDHLPDCVYVKDSHKRFLIANSAAAEIMGAARAEELAGKTDADFYPPAIEAEFAADEDDVLRSGRPLLNKDEPHLDFRGRARQMLTTKVPLKDSQGGIVGLVGVTRDITERKEAEEALRRRVEEIERLLDVVPAAMWVASDPQCLSITGNRRANEFYEAHVLENVSAIAGTQVRRFFTPKGRELGAGELPMQVAAATNQDVRDAEVHVQLPSGRRMVVLGNATPLRNELGQVRGCIGAFVDITQHKEAEEQQRRHQAELAHVGRVSTMGEMAASLAHELNQPLHAIKNYANGGIRRLLKRADKDEDLAGALEQISQEANRAAEIIRRIRRFVEKRQPQIAEVPVNRLVEEAVHLIRGESERRRVKVVLELEEELPTVLGDPIQIEQVLFNIVLNGVESMADVPDDQRLLTIKSTRHGEDRVQIDVRDRGVGVSKKKVERIFEPFFTTKSDGLGMGLAISRSIVQAHDGRLWVSLNDEGGCTFHLLLPSARRF